MWCDGKKCFQFGSSSRLVSSWISLCKCPTLLLCSCYVKYIYLQHLLLRTAKIHSYIFVFSRVRFILSRYASFFHFFLARYCLYLYPTASLACCCVLVPLFLQELQHCDFPAHSCILAWAHFYLGYLLIMNVHQRIPTPPVIIFQF